MPRRFARALMFATQGVGAGTGAGGGGAGNAGAAPILTVEENSVVEFMEGVRG